MQNIIELIQENEEVEKNIRADMRELLVERTMLKNAGFPIWDEEFDELLKHFNGIYYDGAFVFGIKPESKVYSDVLSENRILCAPENLLLLGYNEWDYLAFNNERKEYQLLDKDDLEPMFSGCLSYILRHFLKI